jgi:hypothetical protein
MPKHTRCPCDPNQFGKMIVDLASGRAASAIKVPFLLRLTDTTRNIPQRGHDFQLAGITRA